VRTEIRITNTLLGLFQQNCFKVKPKLLLFESITSVSYTPNSCKLKMDNKRLLMYVHHLCSVHHIQLVTINTKKALSGNCSTHRLPKNEAAAYIILNTLINCENKNVLLQRKINIL